MASSFFGINAGTVPPGSPVEVGVFIDTEGETVNAVAGDIILPVSDGASLLNGGSLVSLWLVPPSIVGDRVHFEGVIPGGITSSQLPLFSIVLTPESIGNLSVASENVHVYKHDGLGTKLAVNNGKLTIKVEEGVSPATAPTQDLTPPELFTPVLVRDPNIADGKLAVIFSATDPDSGISSYEVRESRGLFSNDHWLPAQASPYVLTSQSWPAGKVQISAIDRAGNIRTVELTRPLDGLAVMLFGGCILFVVVVILLCTTLYRRGLWRKQKHSRSR